MGEFPTDYILGAIGEVGEAVDALEEPVAGHQAGRHDRVGVGWIRQEDSVNPEASKVGGGGRVLAYDEGGVDHAGGEVVGPAKVRG
jgi:hypothetical protein